MTVNHDELLSYIRRAQNGDDFSKEIIFKENNALIKSIVRRFKNKGVEYEDLFQIACIGFVKAINNFNESYNVKFSTYSVPMIIGEIKRYMRDNGSIKVSRSVKILANKLNRFIENYQSIYNTSPEIELLTNKFNSSYEEVVMALDSAKMPLSIYDKFEDDEEGQELIEKIPTNFSEEKLVNKIQLATIIENLTEKERKIIILRFFRDKTQMETAKLLGVSQVQVSRLENKVLEKIRLKF
ncbi:MAG: sigma-70 family RNA polymerase sigma factor [Clostridia bacterium]|nr:sigma-70 family RNA polymerase sigma factor [Clostridia bacterium]